MTEGKAIGREAIESRKYLVAIFFRLSALVCGYILDDLKYLFIERERNYT